MDFSPCVDTLISLKACHLMLGRPGSSFGDGRRKADPGTVPFARSSWAVLVPFPPLRPLSQAELFVGPFPFLFLGQNAWEP